MSDSEIEEDAPSRVSYQLTEDEKMNLCVAIARYQGHGKLARGNLTKISEAFQVSDTAVSKIAKRLEAGEPPCRIIKLKKVGNRNSFAHDNNKLLAAISRLKYD